MRLLTSRRKLAGTSGDLNLHRLQRTQLRIEQLEDRSMPSGNPLFAGVSGNLLHYDPVLLWNRVALAVHVIDHTPGFLPGSGLLVQGGPTRTSRALGMVQGAVFDAVNSIDHSFTPYLLTRTFGSFASKPAAVAVASHDTLVSLYPQQRVLLDMALGMYLAAIPNGSAETVGIRAGHAAAAAMVAARANDGSDVMMMYMPGDQPGEHRPDPLNPTQGFLTPMWGDVTPFTLNTGGGTDAFLATPPPPLTSAEYTAAFNEVKVVGAVDAETADRDGNGLPDRTHEQTVIGIFWGYDGSPGLGTPPRFFNQIAQTLAVQQHNTLVQNARMFALINLAMADAGIQCWDTKYEFNFWRPILGIREADVGTGPSGLGDGNLDTHGEAGWSPLGAPYTNAPPGSTNFTPPFPAYTSGHATFGAAMFQMLSNFYGRDNITFTIVSDEFNGRNRDVSGAIRPLVPRTFTSFSKAAEENGQSRIYLGIHWSFDKVEGIVSGDRIANFVFDNFLQRRGATLRSADERAPASSSPSGDSVAIFSPKLASLPAVSTSTNEPAVKPADASDSTSLTLLLTPSLAVTEHEVQTFGIAAPAMNVGAAPAEVTDPLALDRWSVSLET